MTEHKQVDKSHYAFGTYMSKPRWSSLWHQLDEVARLAPRRVLEIGPGPGLFKRVAATIGIPVETMDLDPELNPDHIGSATAMPFDEGEFDVVCAFQVLEHMPYEMSLVALAEMARVTRRHIVLSLPDARWAWRYQFHVPKLGSFDFLVPRPQLRPPVHQPDPEHHWEINKRGFELARVCADLSKRARLVRTYRVQDNPYHRFFVMER